MQYTIPGEAPDANWWLLVQCSSATCSVPARIEKHKQVWFVPGLLGDDLNPESAAYAVALLLLALLH